MRRALLLAGLLCAGCPSHPEAVPDAGPGDAGGDAGEASWQVVLQHLDGTLLAVWGTSALLCAVTTIQTLWRKRVKASSKSSNTGLAPAVD